MRMGTETPPGAAWVGPRKAASPDAADILLGWLAPFPDRASPPLWGEGPSTHMIVKRLGFSVWGL
jgi:hypothetical protein